MNSKNTVYFVIFLTICYEEIPPEVRNKETIFSI